MYCCGSHSVPCLRCSVGDGTLLLACGGIVGTGCKWGCGVTSSQGKGSAMEAKTCFSFSAKCSKSSAPCRVTPPRLFPQSCTALWHPGGFARSPVQRGLRPAPAPCPLLGAMCPFCPSSGKALGSHGTKAAGTALGHCLQR